MLKQKKTSFIGFRISKELEQKIIDLANRSFKGKKSKAIIDCLTRALK